ncbi:hypothetical protein ABN306_01460 [Providencia huaxiensis]|uniref:hypothetical protein n=1 Tax=Providencia TaxID=586 RepID=UPI001EFE32F9|nr:MULTISPECIES: hypothetical protein [Providencia]MCG9537390.1 hypothetical protein [Providencia huaxiensis]
MKLPSGEVKAIARQNELVNDLLITNTEEIEMKKLNTSLLALALLTVGFTAAANGVNHKMPRQHMGNHHNMVYSVTEQTTTPNETVKKLANSTPKIEDGKRYVVKVTVMEAPEFKAMNTMPTPEPMRAPAANQ